MNKQPFMPLFFGDLLASTQAWDGEERALYVILLACQWSSGPLPSDPKRIARMVQYDHDTFSRLWSIVSTKFHQSDAGLINPRLEQHREKANEISNKRANAGAKGGATTQAKMKQMIDEGTSKNEANASNLLGHPIQTKPYQSKPKKNPKNTSASPPLEFEDLKKVYPKRAGDQGWPEALRRCEAHIKRGTGWNEILDGAARYAAYVRTVGNEGSQYVKTAAVFCGPDKHFLSDWPIPKNRGEIVRDSNINASLQWLSDQEKQDAAI